MCSSSRLSALRRHRLRQFHDLLLDLRSVAHLKLRHRHTNDLLRDAMSDALWELEVGFFPDVLQNIHHFPLRGREQSSVATFLVQPASRVESPMWELLGPGLRDMDKVNCLH